jgi:hypothetical protein
MNAQRPKYMTIKGFCQYSGFSKYQFFRLARKAGISIKDLGTGMGNDWRGHIVDVQEALAAIDALPEADKEMPINLQPSPADPAEDAAEETQTAEETEAAE